LVAFFEVLAVPDGHQAILKAMSLTHVIVDVTASYYPCSSLLCDLDESSDAFTVTECKVVLQFKIVVGATKPVKVLSDQLYCLIEPRGRNQMGQLSPFAAGKTDQAS
jgi:hypothetical protein